MLPRARERKNPNEFFSLITTSWWQSLRKLQKNEMIEVIRLYCDNVKTVEPDSDQAKMLIKNNVKALTNERERSILTYPTEIALLYAISEISPKYFYINQNFPLKKTLQNSLVNRIYSK